jgi:hypothetical protein
MKFILTISFVCFALLGFGCGQKKSDDSSQGNADDTIKVATAQRPLVKISSGYARGAATKIDVFASDSLAVGYNKLYVALADSATGTPVTEAHIHLTPTMSMPGMQHGSPQEDPPPLAANGKFSGAAIFSMASNEMMIWTLNVKVHNHASMKEGTATLPVSVRPSSLLQETLTADNKVLMISLMRPVQPKSGVTDVEIVVHRQQDKMTFVSINDYAVSLSAEMTGMAAETSLLTPTANGHYAGKVNLSMAGDWKLLLTFKQIDNVVATTGFAITVK